MNEKLAKIIFETADRLYAKIDSPDVEAWAKAIESAFVLTERKPREFWLVRHLGAWKIHTTEVPTYAVDSQGNELEVIKVKEVWE